MSEEKMNDPEMNMPGEEEIKTEEDLAPKDAEKRTDDPDTENSGSESSDETSRNRGGKRLSPEQWAEIRTIYETVGTSIIQLSAKFGVSRQSINAHFQKFGVVRNSKSASIARAVAETEKRAESWESQRADRIEKAREKALAIAIASENEYAKIIQTVRSGATTWAAQKENLRALKLFVEGATLVKDSKLETLQAENYTNEEDLPQIVIEDLGEDDLEAMRNRGLDDEDDVTIAESGADEVVTTE